MANDRERILVEHDVFDWGQIDGATLKDAGSYLLKLAEILPDNACIVKVWTGDDLTDIRAISYRDESDEEYTTRKRVEAEKARRDEEQRKRDNEWVMKRAEYNRLKDELGL